MRTTVYLRIMQCFSDIFKSFPHTRGGDPNVETMTRCDMCFSPHTWGWPLEKSFPARPFPHTRGGDPWDFQYFSTFPHTRGGWSQIPERKWPNAVNTWTFMVMERNSYYRTCKCNRSHCSIQAAQRRIQNWDCMHYSYSDYTDLYYCYDSMRSGSDAHISSQWPMTEVTGLCKRAQILGMLARVHWLPYAP